MANPFYSVFESHGISAQKLSDQSNEILMPFAHYLQNSITTLEKKEVSCNWEPVKSSLFTVKANKKIWKYTPESKIAILNNREDWYEIISASNGETLDEMFSPDMDEEVVVRKGKVKNKFKLSNKHFQKTNSRIEVYIPGLGEHTVIQWDGYQLNIRPLVQPLDDLTQVHVDGAACAVIARHDDTLTIDGIITAQSEVSVAGQRIEFKLLTPSIETALASIPYQKHGAVYYLFTKQQPAINSGKIEDVTQAKLAGLSTEHFTLNNKQLNAADWNLKFEKGTLTLEDINTSGLLTSSKLRCQPYPEIEFSAEASKQNKKWIQLIEKTGGVDTGKSDLDTFFSDNNNFLKLLDSSQRQFDEGFRIIESRPEERQILLAKNTRGKKNWSDTYPGVENKKQELRVSEDTSQLKRQKEAINRLKCRPAHAHWPLIQLLQDKDSITWRTEQLELNTPIDWKELSNEEFDGCNTQREFVRKAIASPDFAILDGPPGTGKTTTILELIAQYALEGKRVLLTASTHAAINNVLERVKENQEFSELIFPLRIGDAGTATRVEEYQFDTLWDSLNVEAPNLEISKQLMVDSSNLVCGTTIGILRLFREKEVKLDTGEPPFDLMIIDECSKTTLQEFLVPALYAKKWVLVGDERQLSPFTDRDQIVSNLEHLLLKPPRGRSDQLIEGEYLSPYVQEACFLLDELRGSENKPYKTPILVPVSDAVLCALEEEIRLRMDTENFYGLCNITLVKKTTFDSIQQSPTLLYTGTIFFVDERIMPKLTSLIPDDMIVLHPDWHRSAHCLVHNQSKTPEFEFQYRSNRISESKDLYAHLQDRQNSSSWAEEICWRIERMYWLRQAKQSNSTNYLQKQLTRLTPMSVNTETQISRLKTIAFSSILEALSGSGFSKSALSSRRNNSSTTLNQGFPADAKQQRHSTLDYQHRMHPDISKFPRECFYKDVDLKDGCKTTDSRSWDYTRYDKRSVWLNTTGNEFKKSNSSEVDAIIRELEAFTSWAKSRADSNNNKSYDVAILTFYKNQEKSLREGLQKLTGNKDKHKSFSYEGVHIKLATVDYFQGQEADLVFLSMVNNKTDGFTDSPNRLNVAITRARYQLVVVGNHNYFSGEGTNSARKSRSTELNNLAKSCTVFSIQQNWKQSQ